MYLFVCRDLNTSNVTEDGEGQEFAAQPMDTDTQPK